MRTSWTLFSPVGNFMPIPRDTLKEGCFSGFHTQRRSVTVISPMPLACVRVRSITVPEESLMGLERVAIRYGMPSARLHCFV